MELNIQEHSPSIKLIKGQKDSYGWEVKVYGRDMDKNLEQLNYVNDRLKEQYSNSNGDKK